MVKSVYDYAAAHTASTNTVTIWPMLRVEMIIASLDAWLTADHERRQRLVRRIERQVRRDHA